MRFMAIDQGTTSTRTLVVEADGAMRVAHAISHKQIYSRADTAAKLRVKTETVKRLLDIGLLREKLIRFGDHGRTAHVVTARTVEKFNAKYISLGKLADIQNRVPGPLAMQLRAAKILPHKDVHGVGNIYRRSQVFEPR